MRKLENAWMVNACSVKADIRKIQLDEYRNIPCVKRDPKDEMNQFALAIDLLFL